MMSQYSAVCRQQHHWSASISSSHERMEPSVVSCFPRGLISLNASVNYLIEPLPASTDVQQHAVFRAESLHLPGGGCLLHQGNKEHEEELNDFIHGMTSPQGRRVSLDVMDNSLLPEDLHAAYSVLTHSVIISRKKETWAGAWST